MKQKRDYLIWKQEFEKDMFHLFKNELNINNYEKIVKERVKFQRGKEILNEIEEHINLKGKKILDIGSGWGDVEYEALRRNYNIIGLEPFPKLIKLSKLMLGSKKNIIKEGYAENLPFKDNSFDIIIVYTVLEHVKDYKKTLKEIHRVLKNNGKAYIYLPNYLFPREGHYKVYGLFFLPKILNKYYLMLLGKNPNFFLKHVSPVNSYQVIKHLKKNNFKIRDLSKEEIMKKGIIYKLLGFLKLYSNQKFIVQKNETKRRK